VADGDVDRGDVVAAQDRAHLAHEASKRRGGMKNSSST
jgi:hypothetical protein